MAKPTVKLTFNGGNDDAELNVQQGTMGPAAFDISKLYAQTGLFTYDPGFLATASCHSSITYIDGEQGVLLYRGYPIDQLADKATYLEVAYLLMHGELPTEAELCEFENIITYHTMMNETLKSFFNGFHHNAHPMAMLVGVMGSLSAFYHDSLNIHDPRHRVISAHRMLAKMPTTAAPA